MIEWIKQELRTDLETFQAEANSNWDKKGFSGVVGIKFWLSLYEREWVQRRDRKYRNFLGQGRAE